MTTRREYCCQSYAGTPNERLANHFYERTEAWYAEHPIAVGCADPKDARKAIKHHQRACQEAVREEYEANAEQVHQACGIVDPVSIFSIILFLIRLFYDFTHGRDA